MALALILGVMALAGWGMAAACRLELEGQQAMIHALHLQLNIRVEALKVAEIALRYWECEAEAEPPLTEIPAAFRQAFGEGEL